MTVKMAVRDENSQNFKQSTRNFGWPLPSLRRNLQSE
jgi:hypothetical protein